MFIRSVCQVSLANRLRPRTASHSILMTGMVATIQWTEAGLVMIDQTRLSVEEKCVTCRTYEEVADAIRSMVIRGAPAIGVAAPRR